MKKKGNTWKIIGVIIIAFLLLYWLFMATTIDEEDFSNPQTAPELIEQTN